MKLIGSVIAVLNRIENMVVVTISSAFHDFNCHNQEKGILLNDIINDDKIFCKFEEKRLLFQKVIKRTAFIVQKENIEVDFRERKYLDFCEKIKKVQSFRNIIAHNYLSFSKEGLAIYTKRKPEQQLLTEKEQKKGSLRAITLNLEEILKESIDICDYGESIFGELIGKIFTIFNHSVALPEKSDQSHKGK